mmetsp:Transcript_41500/g.50296  ORF Transcript_41500/g.50296 Transcript_41500/m.50296 type:complete len:545 (+) Transcript_41500:180-1814(+)|eukprot:CAMPEP_0197852480 /NCGR_PEP_ID=MMETSP1438-20131217/20706_1 /TAXON_ID=1461541 /ORGANISM="Pterosperma sp., Strain CCMP1384" /LENGTH=544 /DNA_ID=CAMNT_0043466557 /DNA_START=180 /DNA_END=1814 /DNA_ORIENTATION=+
MFSVGKLSPLALSVLVLLPLWACIQPVQGDVYIPSLFPTAAETKPIKPTSTHVTKHHRASIRGAAFEKKAKERRQEMRDKAARASDDQWAISEQDRHSWNFEPFVRDKLTPWNVIHPELVNAAQLACRHAVTAFRARIIDGRLYIEDIRALWFARPYAASAKLTLLRAMKDYGPFPDLDVVINQGDYPVVVFPKDPDHWQRKYGNVMMPPIFSPTGSGSSVDLPWPDFSFMPPSGKHDLVTPRWDQARRNVLEAGSRIPWEQKLSLAAWTGNTQAEPRQRLMQAANQTDSKLFVNSIFFKQEIGKISCWDSGQGQKGGLQVQKCGMSFEELCHYKYLINVGSNGYANKLKYLFLCNSTVLHVLYGSPSREFFEEQLLAGVHYVPVQKVEDLPAVVEELENDQERARRIAEAGTARMKSMDMLEVTKYVATALKGYASRMNYKPRIEDTKKSFEVNCEDDLWRHYEVRNEHEMWYTQNNATCLHPPAPEDIKAPGWGGAYHGSSPTCSQANDLYELPEICDKPHHGGALHQTRKGIMDWEPPPPR